MEALVTNYLTLTSILQGSGTNLRMIQLQQIHGTEFLNKTWILCHV